MNTSMLQESCFSKLAKLKTKAFRPCGGVEPLELTVVPVLMVGADEEVDPTVMAVPVTLNGIKSNEKKKLTQRSTR